MVISPIIHRYNEVVSTNDIALEMARSGAPEGTVVLARSQSKGRGRRGRAWLTEPDQNVLMSVVLKPTSPVTELPFIAAVAVVEYLCNSFRIDPKLKWPNDVIVQEKKIAGILVETTPDSAIVGIGLNINQPKFPIELADIATSIFIETGTGVEVDAAAQALLNHLFATYQLPFKEILTRWQKYMWGCGRSVEITTEEGNISGFISGIDSDGALLIDSSGAQLRIIAADAIHLITEDS